MTTLFSAYKTWSIFMNVSCYAIEVKPNNSTKRLGVKFTIVNVYEQIFPSSSAHALRKRHELNSTNNVAGFAFFGKKVKEKGEEIMYLYGERNLKEKLKILIFEI